MKIYTFDYNMGDAYVKFKVDPQKFTNADAKLLLEFFTWSYDETEDLTSELLKKYSIEVIRISSGQQIGVIATIAEMNDMEGFPSFDGSVGIELIEVEYFEFNEDDLLIDIKQLP